VALQALYSHKGEGLEMLNRWVWAGTGRQLYGRCGSDKINLVCWAVTACNRHSTSLPCTA